MTATQHPDASDELAAARARVHRAERDLELAWSRERRAHAALVDAMTEVRRAERAGRPDDVADARQRNEAAAVSYEQAAVGRSTAELRLRDADRELAQVEAGRR